MGPRLSTCDDVAWTTRACPRGPLAFRAALGPSRPSDVALLHGEVATTCCAQRLGHRETARCWNISWMDERGCSCHETEADRGGRGARPLGMRAVGPVRVPSRRGVVRQADRRERLSVRRTGGATGNESTLKSKLEEVTDALWAPEVDYRGDVYVAPIEHDDGETMWIMEGAEALRWSLDHGDEPEPARHGRTRASQRTRRSSREAGPPTASSVA